MRQAALASMSGGRRERPPPPDDTGGSTIFVGCIPSELNDIMKISAHFSQFGQIVKCDSRPEKFYAFVQFKEREQAVAAKEAVGPHLGDPKIIVNWATEKFGGKGKGGGGGGGARGDDGDGGGKGMMKGGKGMGRGRGMGGRGRGLTLSNTTTTTASSAEATSDSPGGEAATGSRVVRPPAGRETAREAAMREMLERASGQFGPDGAPKPKPQPRPQRSVVAGAVGTRTSAGGSLPGLGGGASLPGLGAEGASDPDKPQSDAEKAAAMVRARIAPIKRAAAPPKPSPKAAAEAAKQRAQKDEAIKAQIAEQKALIAKLEKLPKSAPKEEKAAIMSQIAKLSASTQAELKQAATKPSPAGKSTAAAKAKSPAAAAASPAAPTTEAAPAAEEKKEAESSSAPPPEPPPPPPALPKMVME